jgi:phospholipid/cholesterol/gamma-HCH transport system substrate-binding protein
MAKQAMNKIKLGIFVLAGTLLFIFSLYIIGSKKNLFGGTVRISAYFNNVNGLMEGNNVRFNGINIGTVNNIEIIADTVVKVEIDLEDDMSEYIFDNALASIGTEGLMGNKIVNISPGKGYGKAIKEGTILGSIRPIEMDEAIRTLNNTNNNIEAISQDLRRIIETFTGENSILSVFSDSAMNQNIRMGVGNFRETGKNLTEFVDGLNLLVYDIQKGNGTIGKLIQDTLLAIELQNAIYGFRELGTKAGATVDTLGFIVAGIRNGDGSVGQLINDTTFSTNLNATVISINESAQTFNETMKALRSAPFLKKYFRKEEKGRQESNPEKLEDQNK